MRENWKNEKEERNDDASLKFYLIHQGYTNSEKIEEHELSEKLCKNLLELETIYDAYKRERKVKALNEFQNVFFQLKCLGLLSDKSLEELKLVLNHIDPDNRSNLSTDILKRIALVLMDDPFFYGFKDLEELHSVPINEKVFLTDSIGSYLFSRAGQSVASDLKKVYYKTDGGNSIYRIKGKTARKIAEFNCNRMWLVDDNLYFDQGERGYYFSMNLRHLNREIQRHSGTIIAADNSKILFYDKKKNMYLSSGEKEMNMGKYKGEKYNFGKNYMYVEPTENSAFFFPYKIEYFDNKKIKMSIDEKEKYIKENLFYGLVGKNEVLTKDADVYLGMLLDTLKEPLNDDFFEKIINNKSDYYKEDFYNKIVLLYDILKGINASSRKTMIEVISSLWMYKNESNLYDFNINLLEECKNFKELPDVKEFLKAYKSFIDKNNEEVFIGSFNVKNERIIMQKECLYEGVCFGKVISPRSTNKMGIVAFDTENKNHIVTTNNMELTEEKKKELFEKYNLKKPLFIVG
jgi:hypothetical protein